jgi:hypothetical protein
VFSIEKCVTVMDNQHALEKTGIEPRRLAAQWFFQPRKLVTQEFDFQGVDGFHRVSGWSSPEENVRMVFVFVLSFTA